MKRVLVVIAALAFSAGVAAQMYKWKDKDGKVRYGDTPPPGAETTRIRGPAGAPPPAAPEANKEAQNEKPLTPEQAFRKRQEERQAADDKAAKERAQADEKQTNCAQAQTQLRLLESGQRIASVNAAGERVFMDEDQRAREMARAQKAAADWCK